MGCTMLTTQSISAVNDTVSLETIPFRLQFLILSEDVFVLLSSLYWIMAFFENRHCFLVLYIHGFS